MANDPNTTPIDPLSHLPLALVGSDPIPPAPTRSRAIDFLHDFAGYSWVAYGAASLLVISHFPSPLSSEETLVGPILRQTFELSASEDEVVEAVAWSSDGDVAAACGNCVVLFRNDANRVPGSFCWSQNAVLVQSTKVEAIKWTASGDGIIAGGIEVILWKNRNRSWEIAWKFKADQPQTMLSATWSIVGPLASVTDICNEVNSKCVSLYYGDGKHQYAKAELHHPQPVTLIQWRRPVGRHLDSDASHLLRNVLLTCCLDGTARLWCEIYNGKSRNVGKDNDHKKVRRTFSVAAVIDVNRVLNGTLGSDVFLTWATEVKGIFNTSGGRKIIFSNEEHDCDKVGACEWLVGFGPGMLVSYWPIHCLDDISPMRFPRVMLWKKQKLKHGCLHGASLPNFQELLLNNAIIARNCLSSPPALCSLIHYFPGKILAWSVFYSQVSNNTDESSQEKSNVEDFMSSSATGALNLSGHTGKIVQVAVHPHSCEVELAASLDSNGELIFWSLSNINSCNAGLPNLLPAWELCGKLSSQNLCSKYTSLRWAPSMSDEDQFLFMGHVKGIDCFMVRFSQTSKENIECDHFCTIPFTVHGPYDDGPTDIFTVPLASTCDKAVRYNRFMLLGVWIKGFEALSWEITLRSYDSLESYSECNLEREGASDCNMYNFESTFSGRHYCISVAPCSLCLPDGHANDEVTSFSVVCSTNLTLMQQKLGSNNDLCQMFPAYVMATGCADGTLKLWRSKKANSTIPLVPWELVGVVAAHPGPILAISINNCGQKIATIGKESHSCVLKIWDILHLPGLGGYVLEDTITLDKHVVSLKWLPLGNGLSLLGVCMQNELRVYSQSRYGVLALTSSRRCQEVPNWSCVALAHTLVPIHNFVWGPRATAIIIHHSYFTLFNQSLSLSDKSYNSKLHPTSIKALTCEEELHNHHFSSVFTDNEVGDYKELLLGGDSGNFNSSPHLKINISKSCLYSSLLMALARIKRGPVNKHSLWRLPEVIERLGGFLPVYHPEALLANICSGNWKRAIVSLRHLSESLTSIDSQKRNGPGKDSYIIPQILLSKYFEQTMTTATDKGHQWGPSSILTAPSSQIPSGVNLFALNMDSDASSNMLIPSSTQSELCDLSDSLERNYELAAITEAEKLNIQAIIDLLSEVSDAQSVCPYASLDEPGRRYWTVLRFQQLVFYRKFGRKPALEELVIDSALLGWAFHSDCQENLFGCLLPSEPSWQEMRSLGVGYWFTNETDLRKRMEKLARMQYLKKKDPKDCALLYIALNRIQVLAGLFKISKNEKDKPLVAFLTRNFQDEKNKAAALKNAYVLLGRHQFELAIAFFLLGGDTVSAATVCAKNLGDEQLALVICRLIEGRGGQLQNHLIRKILIPSAIENNDYWLASLLEWELGNHTQSFLSMLGFHVTSAMKKLAVSTNNIAFVDPNIGLYCQTLAANNRMRKAVGERDASILVMWANFMTETALRRSGLLLEALECHSSSLSGPAIVDQDSASENEQSEVLPEILKPSAGKSSNWMLHDVSIFLELYAKSDMALHYLSKLIKEHPNWSDKLIGGFPAATKCSKEYKIYPYQKLYDDFRLKLSTVLGEFEHKYSVISTYLLNMAFLYMCNTGMMFIGYDILHGYASQDDAQNKQELVDSFFIYLYPYKPLLKVTKELSFLSSRFILTCSMTCTHQSKLGHIENEVSTETSSNWSDVWSYYLQDILLSCWNVRAALRIMPCHPTEDIISESLNVLDLVEYYVYFSSAWLNRNSKVILLMVQPLPSTSAGGHTPGEVNSGYFKNLIYQNEELLANQLLKIGPKKNIQVSSSVQNRSGDITHPMPEDELWHVIGACLWQRMFRFLKSQSTPDCDNLGSSCFNGDICSEVSNIGSCSGGSESEIDRTAGCMKSVSMISMKLLKITLMHLSSFQIKQLALFLRKKVENGTYSPTLLRLEQSFHSPPMGLSQNPKEDNVTHETMTTEDELSNFQALSSICDNAHLIAECFVLEKIDWLHYFKHKTSKGWMDFHKYISEDHKNEDGYSHEGKIRGNPAKTETRLHNQNQPKNSHTSILQKDTVLTDEVTLFHKPKEVYKRNGELLEALCTNSINQQEAAIASNRKGIVFFNWEDGMPSLDQADYIWSDADWPHNGWAGSQSTPVPTCVSPGVGLGSNKGAHLGLGGATIGVGSYGRPQRSFSGGGAFGVPAYAGIGASGLGWEVQADFEEFSDPPATVDNIVTRAFSSHPSRPLFLVGSVNTHIYLWEFGKDTATATYGVMPAANVPPPYALASISALQFDHFGHRFASAALDGTICTWQLEVGGRSNIYPTESSLCFNNHARDVTFVTSSGSIVAAAGYSSNGVNVVVWDTLAPPTTSRASIVCHEGGARSISVFDNDMGSGSVSPFIVTGGKNGDVGLHDFRYIATGKTKRHRQANDNELSANLSTEGKHGEQNANGMLWYIPKAHSGNIARIATIPNTSLFLTGSKDGDVKLWDAKRARLMHHWPKLHERHTFLQPSSSRGFGEVVRAAVTDIQIMSHGFLTCGGDGSVKLIQFKDYKHNWGL